MPAKENKELLEQILKEIHSMQQELLATKTAVGEIRIEVAKLRQIDEKLKKGENLATTNGGWFWSS